MAHRLRDPLPASRVLTKKSLAGGKIVYCKSKALGEKMLFENLYRARAAYSGTPSHPVTKIQPLFQDMVYPQHKPQ